MRRSLFLFTILALTLSGADKKRKGPKPPDVEIVEVAGHRGQGVIGIDGTLRNTGEKPIKGLVLLFDFMAPGRQVVTTQKGALDEELLEPGSEAVFRVALNAPPRAVEFQINAVDGSSRELRVANPGPFVIE